MTQATQPNTNFTHLLTHAGKFHADEVLGRALTIVLGFPGEFIRTNEPTANQIHDPKVLVWDIGERYNTILNNYDHHQDGKLPAACVLLLRHFYPAGPVRDILENRLFRYVSHVDTGELIGHGRALHCADVQQHYPQFEQPGQF